MKLADGPGRPSLEEFLCKIHWDFRFEEAEHAIAKATTFRHVDFWASPFTDYGELLADKGNFVDAWACLQPAQEQRRQRPAYTLVMDQHEFDRTVAYILFLLGRGGDALETRYRRAGSSDLMGVTTRPQGTGR